MLHRHFVKMDLNFDEEFLQMKVTKTVQHHRDSVAPPLRSSGLIGVSLHMIFNELKHRRTICEMIVTLDLSASRLIVSVVITSK